MLSKLKRKLPEADLLASLGMLLAGLFFAAFGARAAYLNAVARGWPTATGTVLRGETDYISEVTSFTLTYAYFVEGNRYEGRTDEVSDEFVNGHSLYQTGAPLKVHYNPARPQISFVKPGVHLSHVLWLMAGIALLGAGCFGIWTEMSWKRALRRL